MGINIKVEKVKKAKDVISIEAKLERDLRDCMHCKFFYGHNSQCIKNDCVKKKEEKKPEYDRSSKCFGCPYKQSDQYCFPCMKELLGMPAGKGTHEEIILEQEEFDNG